ncbi:MAG: response regulator [Bdellovibrionota bacterium]|nr:MAG: response regulator [Pseudomonadota bacterium]
MGKKILVIDDSSTARQLIVNHLDGLGHTIIQAADGDEGLMKANAETDISLIFSDINMPHMNGLEMVERLKKSSKTNTIPICLLTTETGNEELQRAKTLGVNAFLVKPIKKEQILAVVNGLLSTRQN